MEVAELLNKLGYPDSPNFLKTGGGELESVPGYGHIFRLAADKLGLTGVFVLRSQPSHESPIVPIVYVCEAKDDEEADKTHQLVWNQDVVPFLIVRTPTCIRLYSGFRHRKGTNGVVEGVLRVLKDFNQLSDLMDGFHADAINDGRIWQKWGKDVRPEDRVDWRLLADLQALDGWLQSKGLRSDVSHSLIGKYVYLHYLKDRDILSQRKFAAWNIPRSEVFGRGATRNSTEKLVNRLDEWLNGGVFPLTFRGKNAPSEDHLQRVAATFAGDSITKDGSWELHLDFQAYDFSYIPIETLSVVYEQFLHEPDAVSTKNKGKEAGAYYTPIPVVNFMLAETADRRPLQAGMKVLDPSCGSGAFLVQCYRRLIETEFPPSKPRPTPTQLRTLLERSIFGVDRDADACSVTELSLVITLLDYVTPPDLENGRNFKLPSLRNQNIFHADFFADGTPWRDAVAKKKFHWIVGNPPWKKLRPALVLPEDKPSLDWMAAHRRDNPIGGYQVAQAFAWKVCDHLAPDGEISLLLPAMSLFENHSREFRAAFFEKNRVDSVANFSNLRWVLFRGRSVSPAAAFFYSPCEEGTTADLDDCISVYSPMLANQEATRTLLENDKTDAWSLLLNASEIRSVPLSELSGGTGLAWKLAAWGSHLDQRLLEKLARRFQSLRQLERDDVLIVAEGPQLKSKATEKGTGKTENCPEVSGKKVLDEEKLAVKRPLFFFPDEALKDNLNHHLRIRGGRAGLDICKSPHVIVNAARCFAVYSDDYLIVPSRQIGIASKSGDSVFLKALSLYLSSDFAFYHQFLTSTEFGVERGVATLKALRQIPIPLLRLSRSELSEWSKLHTRLVRANRARLAGDEKETLFSKKASSESLTDVVKELNTLVFETLQLTKREQALVHDLIQVRLELIDGNLGKAAVAAPSTAQMLRYAKRLKSELDAFVDGVMDTRHQVAVVFDSQSAMIRVDLTSALHAAKEAEVFAADNPTAEELEKARRTLRAKWANWVYFERNLRVFDGTQTFVLKPMQRFHWTETQAMFDASEIISETLEGERTTA